MRLLLELRLQCPEVGGRGRLLVLHHLDLVLLANHGRRLLLENLRGLLALLFFFLFLVGLWRLRHLLLLPELADDLGGQLVVYLAVFNETRYCLSDVVHLREVDQQRDEVVQLSAVHVVVPRDRRDRVLWAQHVRRWRVVHYY